LRSIRADVGSIDARRLVEIRSERIELMGGDRRCRPERGLRGPRDAAAIHKRLGCPVIDVSGSREEIALRIVRAVESGQESVHEAEASRTEVALGDLVSLLAAALVIFYGSSRRSGSPAVARLAGGVRARGGNRSLV
jgi:hypothetical protein